MSTKLTAFGTGGNFPTGDIFWVTPMALPARCDAAQAAKILGFQEHDIPILLKNGLLKPLAKPVPNAVKYFHTDRLLEMARDGAFLSKATQATYDYWKFKTERKTSHGVTKGKSTKVYLEYKQSPIDIHAEVTPEELVMAER